MKIALLGDVHGNLPALEAVLEHAAAQGADETWNLGDFVGYGPFPDEVVQRLRAVRAVSIQGNYDRKTLQVKDKLEKWRRTKAPEKWQAFLWAYEHLSEESRAYLAGLPEETRLQREGWDVLMVHGSPASQDEHLTPATPPERLEELAAQAGADMVLCGHSHLPFFRDVGSTWWINPGAVGRPDDGDPRAGYALLSLEPGRGAVRHFRVEYDVALAVAAIRENHLPEIFEQMLIQGRDLEAVRAQART